MKKINLALFFSNNKGNKIYNYFKKKKLFKIKKVFFGYKYLNSEIPKKFKKGSYEIIKKIDSPKLVQKIKKLNIDFIIIAGFHYILKKDLIYSPKFCTLNLHSGRVPNYRGGSPLNWQLINNEKYIYLSVLKVDLGIDTGDVIMQKKFKIKKHFDIKIVHNIANKEFPKMLEKSLLDIYRGISKPVSQKTLKLINKTYKQRVPSDGKIFWRKNTNLQIHNLIRALSNPYPGAFSFNQKKKVIFLKSKISKKNFKIKNYGEVINYKNNIFVKCKNGFLQIIKYKGKLKNNDILI